MQITNNTNTSFRAKFLDSESLRLVADYAVEHGKFDKLNAARKNIDKTCLQTRLRFDIGENNGKPFASFTKFVPKKNVLVANSMDDFVASKSVVYESSKKMNPLKFALEKIIKLGNNAPNNNMYKSVVLTK